MARSITLFTGQWADLPLAELAPLARKMGYDGLELACWGDHFDVPRALASPQYVREKRALLAEHGLQCFAIANHLVGQAVCDPIDARHQAILPARLWGDGDPFFTVEGAKAYLRDLPDARLHVFQTGHFALEEKLPEMAPLIGDFLDTLG